MVQAEKKWRRHQDTVYRVAIQLVQRKGFKFLQTRSNAIILYDALPAYCIPKVAMMEYGEIIYTRMYLRHLDVLQIFPLKIIGCKYWIQKLLEVVKTPNKSNQNHKNPIVRTERLVKSEQPSGSITQEIDERDL